MDITIDTSAASQILELSTYRLTEAVKNQEFLSTVYHNKDDQRKNYRFAYSEVITYKAKLDREKAEKLTRQANKKPGNAGPMHHRFDNLEQRINSFGTKLDTILTLLTEKQ